jgi:beta-aspartyl-peptidase (threonine type)
MRILFIIFVTAFLPSCRETESSAKFTGYALAIHGGAGTIERKDMDAETEKAYMDALHQALDIGEAVLSKGGSSMDAVEYTIKYLEDNPLFNAGKGAVFTHDGKNELDASIMNGENQMAGAVGAVTIVKNPITLARSVMEKSPHVMMTGAGAEEFAVMCKLDTVPPSYFFTQKRWEGLLNAQKEDSLRKADKHTNDKKFGTVGCVALDLNGNIAAGTSTGGMTNKRYNRLGDAPIIGAGTFADNASCGVSCTGHGEFFIRYTVARDIAALMEYKELTLQEACDQIVYKKLVDKGGEGGLIAVDKNGNIEMPFNTSGMYRGWVKNSKRDVQIYK